MFFKLSKLEVSQDRQKEISSLRYLLNIIMYVSNFETKITSILADLKNILNYNFWDVAPMRYSKYDIGIQTELEFG